MKFCKDCKHAMPSPQGNTDEFLCCDLAEKTPSADYLVTGREKFVARYCSVERQGPCGKEAKFWELKP